MIWISEYQQFTTTTAIYRQSIFDKLSGITDALQLQQYLELDYVCQGLAGESGEILNQTKKIIRDDDFEITKGKATKILDELGDVMWYASEICNILGVSLVDVMRGNMEKLKSRQERGKLEGSGDTR